MRVIQAIDIGDAVNRWLTAQYGDTVIGFLTGVNTVIAGFEQGIDGFNLVVSILPGTIVDFVEGVVPILQDRGLMQTEYSEGTLREKLFGQPRLPATHPAARYRR